MDLASAEELIGSCVEKIERSDSGALRLYFIGTAEPLQIPTPWSFTSCLESQSSDNCLEASNIADELIGLEGAELSSVESDGAQFDIRFGSITISTTSR